MTIQVLLFGIASELVGKPKIELIITNEITVSNFCELLKKEHTPLQKLASFAVAVNEEYASNDALISENDIVAIIPPVSGG